eukprot:14559355-Heterocapsa_arctica.AAC.1
METKIKVEELMSAEETRNYQPYKKVKSTCGQNKWTICRHADCYGCYFKKNGGGFHDRRHKRGDHRGDRRLEVQPFLDTGRYRTEDRVHRPLPGNQTSTEKQIEQIWS